MSRRGRGKQPGAGTTEPQPRVETGGASGHLGLMLAALIIAAGTLAYSNSFGGVFVLDDVRAIVP